MTTYYRTGNFNYKSNSLVWGFGGTYETATTLIFRGSMSIDAPAALAVAAVSFESATVNVTGTISSTARAGAVVTLPVPVPPGKPQPSGPVDELIAAGSVIGDARVTFSGSVHAQIEGGGTIGAFSALADAYVTASGRMVSERGFALRTQAASSDAHSVTSGRIEAGGGECAIMVEGRENSFVTNTASVMTGGDHVDGILATARVDLTFSGDRVAALAGSNVTITNSGSLCTSGDGIRAEAQGTIAIRNTGRIDAGGIGLNVRDIDGSDGIGQAIIHQRGVLEGGTGGIIVTGDFATTAIDVAGVVKGGSGAAISTGASSDSILVRSGTKIFGDILTGAGNDVIRIDKGAQVFGVIDTGSGNDTVFLGNAGYVVNGGAGDDVYYAGSGRDVFRFGAGSGGHDQLMGFDLRRDTLAFDVGPVDIRIDGRDTLIAWSDGSLRLVGVASTDLDLSSSWVG
ncbi:hypothetical protein [Pannonibacter sp.]|uniref:hypothetical protein n=1 Tax=Pannonibacter sp. TaxID=1906786 RepID=UPI003F6F4DF0